MKQIELETQKKLELEMLDYVDEICRKNGIRYTLAGGTLLGAVRHGGFIPWDDDIDIILLRPEYEKLIAILKREGKYNIAYPERDGYYYLFTKLMDKRTVMKSMLYNERPTPDMGVYIDIFPVDGCPNTLREQAKFQTKLRRESTNMIMAMFHGYNGAKALWKHVVKAVVFFPRFLKCRLTGSADERKKKLLSDMRRYDVEESEYAGYLLSAYDEILPREVYEDYIDMQFEGRTFMAIRAYDTYLTKLYGDYMTPPPKEKQVSHHPYKSYWKSESDSI